jgi:hypothetical protein
MSALEYQELRAFFAFYSEHFLDTTNLPAELRPMACLEVLEARGRGAAERGLRQGINDIVEMCRHWGVDRVEELDAQLRENRIVTLSEVRRRVSREYQRILKNKKIGDETGYYLIRGILADSSSQLDSEERAILAEMLSGFEGSAVARAKRHARKRKSVVD